MATPLRALIVEDSEDDARLLVRELEREGYRVASERVETAEDLTAALDRGEWDILFADYTMPRFRGTAALEIVGRHHSDVPVIFVSGTMGEDTAVEALKAGAADWVMKGNLKRLLPAVARELRDAEARKKRRAAEEALRTSEERHRLLFEHIADIILVCDRKGRVQVASASLEQVLGLHPDTLIGRTPRWLVVEENLREVREAFARVTADPDAVETIETRVSDGNGLMRVVECVLRNLLDHPDIAGVVVTVRDITSRKQLEAEVLQAQKLESVGRLAGGIAHDFNNLLTAVQGYSDLLLTDDELSECLRPDVEGIREAAERAAVLTRQLLAFGRKQTLDLRPLDLNEVIDQLIGMLERLLGEDVEIHTDPATDLGTVRADAGQMEQVLVNLAVNARDAMPRGGRLTFATANVDLDPPAATTARTADEPVGGPYVRMTVNDTGLGMDAATLDRVFEPFFTTKAAGEGTGLGLATVYGIVKQSGGHVRVASQPGAGTTFEVLLPQVDEESEDVLRAASPGASPRGGTETILVVEDETVVRELVRRVLGGLGYTVHEARSRDEALRILDDEETRVDLMLSDVVLPGSGETRLEEEPAVGRPGIPVLYMSGYPYAVLSSRGILPPGVELLHKPFTPLSLATKVREVLSLNS